MRIEEIPQDDSIYEGHRRACYAQDASGRYVVATSRGWEVERIANEIAVGEVRQRIDEALAQVRAGSVSPLAYHMARAHMNARLLAAHSGFWAWQVRRHLKPKVFAKLPERKLQRYADALALDLATLTGAIA
jgi:hypothetical protein